MPPPGAPRPVISIRWQACLRRMRRALSTLPRSPTLCRASSRCRGGSLTPASSARPRSNLSALLGRRLMIGVSRTPRSGCTRALRCLSAPRCRTTSHPGRWRCVRARPLTRGFDLDANGRRDRGEPGIPRFLIWADYNHDGQRQANEPFSVTDNRGRYVIPDVSSPPAATHAARDAPNAQPRARHRLGLLISTRRHPRRLCQRPRGPVRLGWGPIAGTGTPYAQGRDFGDWLPAQLTVRSGCGLTATRAVLTCWSTALSLWQRLGTGRPPRSRWRPVPTTSPRPRHLLPTRPRTARSSSAGPPRAGAGTCAPALSTTA